MSKDRVDSRSLIEREQKTYPAPKTTISEESTTRRPHDLRHEAVVQMEKSGSEKATWGAKGVRASGLDCMYLDIR